MLLFSLKIANQLAQMIDIRNTFLLATAFLALFAAAEILYRFAKFEVEHTRKIVHIGTGLLTMFFPLLLTSHWNVLLLCGSFAVILIASLRFGFLPSVNAIERESHGSLCFPAAVYFAFLVFEITRDRGVSALSPLLFFYLPILVMAICDPAAALVGRRFPLRTFQCGSGRKSVGGSAAFFVVALVLTTFLLVVFQENDFSPLVLVGLPLLVAVASTASEAFTPQGFDNFSIPLVVLICLWSANWLAQNV